jgi:hypothetical protein
MDNLADLVVFEEIYRGKIKAKKKRGTEEKQEKEEEEKEEDKEKKGRKKEEEEEEENESEGRSCIKYKVVTTDKCIDLHCHNFIYEFCKTGPKEKKRCGHSK